MLRKHSSVLPGPAGETTTYILVVLQKGGAQVEVIVDEAAWKAAIIGDAVPGSASDR